MKFDLDDLVERVLDRVRDGWEGAEPLAAELEERARDLATDQAQLYLFQLFPPPGGADDLVLAERALDARVANLRSAGEGLLVAAVTEALDSIGLEALAFFRGLVEGLA